MELRRSVRVSLDSTHPSRRCVLYDILLGKTIPATIINISRDGFCIETSEKLSHDQVVRVEFMDNVTHEMVSVYTQVLTERQTKIKAAADWVKIFTKQRFRYGCHNCVQLELSKSFIEFYDRSLSDSHVKNLNKTAKPHLTLKELLKFRKPIRYKVSTNAAEREAAYKLVYKEYLARNFTTANPYEMLTSVYQLLPKTVTFVGVQEEKPVMTISAVSDSKFGLPMDKLYSDILEPLRQEGRKLVELTMLSTAKSLFEKGAFSLNHYKKMSALFGIFRHSVRFMMNSFDATDIVISVNPKYEKLYNYLCFDRIGDLRYYKEFNDQPAVAMRLDLVKATDSDSHISLKRACLVRYFFGQKYRNFFKIKDRAPERRNALRILLSKIIPGKRIISDRRQRIMPLTFEDLNYLYVEKSDLAKNLSVVDLKKLGHHFPELKAWTDSIILSRLSSTASAES